MSQDDLGSRENQRPPGRRSRRAWIISMNIAAGVVFAVGFIGVSLSQHNNAPLSAEASPSAAPSTAAPASAAPTTAAPAQPLQFSFTGASQYPCSGKGTIYSAVGGLAVLFSFVNNSSETLQIIWLNNNGNRETYDTLPPGDTYNVNTSIDQAWMIADASTSCQGIFVVNGSGQILVSQ